MLTWCCPPCYPGNLPGFSPRLTTPPGSTEASGGRLSGGPPLLRVYLCSAPRRLFALAPGPESDAGLSAQIASTVKVSADALPLTTVANHVSGGCPGAGCSKSELVMLTAGSVEVVEAPPPTMSCPDGQLMASVWVTPAATGT